MIVPAALYARLNPTKAPEFDMPIVSFERIVVARILQFLAGLP